MTYCFKCGKERPDGAPTQIKSETANPATPRPGEVCDCDAGEYLGEKPFDSDETAGPRSD